MKLITDHLRHMVAGNRTTVAEAKADLLLEMSSINLNETALVDLGRYVLTLVSSDLKAGIRAQKAISAAMRSNEE